MFLIGNKKDRESEREVTREMAEEFRKDKGIHYFVEASAKTGDNVENMFIMASKMLYTHFKAKIKSMVFSSHHIFRKKKHLREKTNINSKLINKLICIKQKVDAVDDYNYLS